MLDSVLLVTSCENRITTSESISGTLSLLLVDGRVISGRVVPSSFVLHCADSQIIKLFYQNWQTSTTVSMYEHLPQLEHQHNVQISTRNGVNEHLATKNGT